MRLAILTLVFISMLPTFESNAQFINILDEMVIGTPEMVNEFFVFENGNRVVIENNLSDCTFFNVKYFDAEGNLLNYTEGGFQEKASAFLWNKDSLSIITVSDMHDVAVLTSIVEKRVGKDTSIIQTIDSIYGDSFQHGEDFINGIAAYQWSAFDGIFFAMLEAGGKLYFGHVASELSTSPIYDFGQWLEADYFSFGNDDSQNNVIFNFYNENWLYSLSYDLQSAFLLDSIWLDDVLHVGVYDNQLLITTSAEILKYSRTLQEENRILLGPENVLINMFDNHLYFRDIDAESIQNHSRTDQKIKLFDVNTMEWSDTISIIDAPQQISKAILLDSILHIQGIYTDLNQAVIQRHPIRLSGIHVAPVSDLQVIDINVVSSNFDQWNQGPIRMSAVLDVTFFQENLSENKDLLQLSSSNFPGMCIPYTMRIFQEYESMNDTFQVLINVSSFDIDEVGDSLRVTLPCSFFLPHGSPLDFNIENNTLCTTLMFPATVLSIGNEKNKVPFKVFPNPARDFLILQFQKDLNFNVGNYQIINILGERVEFGDFDENTREIPIHHLIPGVYTITISDGNNWGSQKFIKQ